MLQDQSLEKHPKSGSTVIIAICLAIICIKIQKTPQISVHDNNVDIMI
jgi:hypothetical protein